MRSGETVYTVERAVDAVWVLTWKLVSLQHGWATIRGPERPDGTFPDHLESRRENEVFFVKPEV